MSLFLEVANNKDYLKSQTRGQMHLFISNVWNPLERMKQNFDLTDFHSDHAWRKKAENNAKFLIDPVLFQVLQFFFHSVFFFPIIVEFKLH